jgi:hypothetical protein
MELGQAVGATLAKVKQSIKGQYGSYCVYRTSWSPINVEDKGQDLMTQFLRHKKETGNPERICCSTCLVVRRAPQSRIRPWY